MAKARRRTKADDDVDVNMTPMIDVVFNLIIFFMVITDMTQKDLELLTLPKAVMALEDEGEDAERLIINIVNPKSQEYAGNGLINPDLPPILMGGEQVQSLDQMRAILRRQADPSLYPDRDKPLPGGGFPSRKPLLVRCDQGAIFGWVQAVMQYCTIVPGRAMEQELRDSPMIYKLEIAVAEREQQG